MKTTIQSSTVFNPSETSAPVQGTQRIQVFPETRSVLVPHWMSWGELHHKLNLFNWAPVGGWRGNKRVSDFSPAGGVNWLQGKYGLSSDQLLAVELPASQGKRKRVTPADAPELFERIRNGGEGPEHPLAYEFRMAPMREERLFGCFIFPIEAGMTVLSAFATYVQDMPEELTAMAYCGLIPGASIDEGTTPHVIISACFTGDAEKGKQLMAPIQKMGPMVGHVMAPMYYGEILNFFEADYQSSRRYHSEFRTVLQLNTSLIRGIMDSVYKAPSPYCRFSVWYKGGKSGKGSAEGKFLLYTEAQWEEADFSALNIHWTRKSLAPEEKG